jgi:hypothetical protein
MEKKTLWAVLAMVLLGAVAFAVMRSPEKGQRTGPPPRPIPAFKAADVVALETTTEKQDKTTLEKTGDGWRVKQPKDWPADGTAIKALLDALEKLSYGDVVTEGKQKHEEMNVADGKAVRLVAKGAGGKVLADFYLGKQLSGFTLLRPAGKDEVWQASGLAQYQVNKDARAWRDHAVFEFAANDAQKLTIAVGPQKLALEREPPEKDKPGTEKWKIVESVGDGPKMSEALDTAQAQSAVQGFASLRAADFADDKQPADVGLERSPMTVTVTAKDKPHTLIIGDTQGEDAYVKDAAAPTIYTVKKYALDKIARRPIDYRDKSIIKVKDADLAAIDIVDGGESLSLAHEGEKWASKGGLKLDEAKLKSLTTAFESLTADGFSEEKDAAKTGLAKPTGTVTLHTKDKKATTLKVGGTVGKDTSELYVQKVGTPDVFIVKKYLVDRFLKKPAELKTDAAPAPSKKPAKK